MGIIISLLVTPSSDDAGPRLAPAQNSRNSDGTVRKQHCPGNPDRHLPLHPPLLMLPHLQPSLPPARGVETTSRHFVCAERVKEAGATEKKATRAPTTATPSAAGSVLADPDRIKTQPGRFAEAAEGDYRFSRVGIKEQTGFSFLLLFFFETKRRGGRGQYI